MLIKINLNLTVFFIFCLFHKLIVNTSSCNSDMMNDNLGISNLSFSAINCNSLNMSNNVGNIQKRKIYGISKLKADIIFVSDLRLSNRNMTNSIDEIKKTFRVNPYCSYTLHHNSSMNKRGVGILVKSCINYTENERKADAGENFLAVRATIQGKIYILCSIYGPNNHDQGFFISLKNALSQLGDFPIIMAGDWNCTYSTSRVELNYDCFNMLELPNVRHSRYLEQLCEELFIEDPYRVLHPVRRDYSYSPFGTVRGNKSRIDFFIISSSLLQGVEECDISYSTQSKLFDHKAINLNFAKKNRVVRTPRIFNNILNDPDLELVVWSAAAECYISNFALNNLTNDDINTALSIVGQVRLLLREAGPSEKYFFGEDIEAEKIANRISCINRAKKIVREHPIEIFHNFNLVVDDDIFLENILNNLRNEVTSYQHFIYSFKNDKKEKLIEELTDLKRGGGVPTP